MATVRGSDTAVYQGRRRTRTPEAGSSQENEWRGPKDRIAALFDTPSALGNPTYVSSEEINGRGRLIARYASEPEIDGPFDQRSDRIEELYGVDMVIDIRQHPMFGPGGQFVLAPDEIKSVTNAINGIDNASWSSTWIAAKKKLYAMLAHGMDSYVDCGFIYRQSVYAARTQTVRMAFGNSGRVPTGSNGQPAPPPTLSVAMSNLIDALPSGEWLQRPPNVEYLGRGKWRLSTEFQWSRAWHVLYGGTLDYGLGR